MRILMISPDLPYPPVYGGQRRIYHLLRGLSANHQVSLLAGVAGESKCDLASNLREFCHQVVTVVLPPSTPRAFREHIGGLLSTEPYYRVVMRSLVLQTQLSRLVDGGIYDVVQAEHLAVAHLVAPLRGIRKVIDMHNVESTYYRRLVRHLSPGIRRLLTLSDVIKLPSYERRLLERFDHCLAVSEVDAQQLRTLAPRARVSVIPNGVDPDEFYPGVESEESNCLVFTARLSYFPNVDAMLFFCYEVLPIIRKAVPDIRLLIVGEQPAREICALRTLSGVEVTGSVPDTRPYLAKATVVVVPVRLGSGTRIKVLEAMAMAKAVVSTSVGAEGLIVRSGEDIEIEDTAVSFAEEVIKLLNDPERRACMGKRARQAILQQYTWAGISARLEEIYQRIRPHEEAVVGG